MNKIFLSSMCGFLSTIPMTTAMIYLKEKTLPAWQRYPLPPRLITMNLPKKVGMKPPAEEKVEVPLSLLNHFAFGSFVGSFFFPIISRTTLARIPAGMLYGFLVWIGSYLGFIPGLRLLPPATKAPAQRNALMITAHLVYGATLGALVHYFEKNNIASH